jgi:uncharacterized protein YggU (UPF0235/DUF167 family)
VDVRLTPRSSRDLLDGAQTLSDGRRVLVARVRAVPEDGRANDALLRLLAQSLDVARSDCSLAAGAKSRVKSVAVRGDSDVLAQRLEAILAAAKR